MGFFDTTGLGYKFYINDFIKYIFKFSGKSTKIKSYLNPTQVDG
jgi:hypothetical protein